RGRPRAGGRFTGRAPLALRVLARAAALSVALPVTLAIGLVVAGAAARRIVGAAALVDRLLGGAHVGARTVRGPTGGVLRAGGLLPRGVPCGLRVGLPVGHGVSSPQRFSSRGPRRRGSTRSRTSTSYGSWRRSSSRKRMSPPPRAGRCGRGFRARCSL